MKVVNIHSRVLRCSKDEISALIATLATHDDRVWPTERWPKMWMKDGMRLGSSGGHGPIRYTVETYDPGSVLQFRFTDPKGFEGIHRFESKALENQLVELKHTIDMRTSGWATLSWSVAIRWLHDALLEDLFDKIENQFSADKKQTVWNLWVRFLRKVLH